MSLFKNLNSKEKYALQKFLLKLENHHIFNMDFCVCVLIVCGFLSVCLFVFEKNPQKVSLLLSPNR